MARSEKAWQRPQTLDLTKDIAVREQHPTGRASIDDVEASVGISLFGRFINLGFYLRGGARRLQPAVDSLVLTFCASMTSLACLTVCRLAGASTAVTLWACLGVPIATVTVGHVGRRRARRPPNPRRPSVGSAADSRHRVANQKIIGKRNRRNDLRHERRSRC